MLFDLNYYGVQTVEKAPFEISRPEGSARYIFFHFTSSVNIDIDGEIHYAPPGSCILYEPKEPQRFFVSHVNLNHDYLDFTCHNASFFEEIRFPLNTVISPKISDYIVSRIMSVHDESNTNRLGTNYIIQSIMENLFVSISRKVNNFSFNSVDYEKSLQRKFEQIRLEIYHNPGSFKVKSMAKSLGFSISHFGHLYKKLFDTTPIKDLTRAKINFIETIDISNYKTLELVHLLGFESIEYFYRWFKKNFNATPNEYRIKTQKGN